MENEPKLVVTNVFGKCQEFAQSIFRDFAEPEAIMFTIHWKIGQNDFPAGTLVTRDNITSNTIVSLIAQISKQERRLVQVIIDQLVALQEQQKEASDK